MKHFILALAFLSHHISYSQEKDELTYLKAPSSPGFSILGIQPTEVSRPKTYEALETSLLNSFTDNGSFIVPRNFALEFSPYWLFSHPRLDYTSFVNPTFGQTIARTSNISIATIDKSMRDDSVSYPIMGLGYRTMIFQGKPSVETKPFLRDLSMQQAPIVDIQTVMDFVLSIDSLKTKDQIIRYLKTHGKNIVKDVYSKDTKKDLNATQISSLRNNLLTEINETLIPYLQKNEGTSNTDVESLMDKIIIDSTVLYNGRKDSISVLAKKIKNANSERYGHMLEFATAGVLEFPTNQFELSYGTKWSAWLTYTYRNKKKNLEFGLMGRFLRNNIPLDSTNNFDLGARLTFQKNQFSLAGEFIGRAQTKYLGTTNEADGSNSITLNVKTDMKFSLSMDYRISDNLVLNYTLGQNFDLNTEIQGNIISQLGLNFGIGGPKISDFIRL